MVKAKNETGLKITDKFIICAVKLRHSGRRNKTKTA